MSAHRLEFLLPESGHLLHMPCHIFLPVGDYESAVNNSKKAIALDREYYKQVGLSAGDYPLNYLSHNLYVFARTYMLMEDYENAIQQALEVANFVQPHITEMPTMAHFSNAPLEIYLYFNKWKEILDYKLSGKIPSAQAYLHFSRATAYAMLGDLASAQKEKELMLKEKDQIKGDEEIAKNPAIHVIELAEVVLKASFQKSKKTRTIRSIIWKMRWTSRTNYIMTNPHLGTHLYATL